MRNSQSLLDAILDDAPRAPVSAAVRESNRLRTGRGRRRLAGLALALAALAVMAVNYGSHSHEKPTPPLAAATPGIRIFSTAEMTGTRLPFFSSAGLQPFTLFSSRDESLAIRNIDDRILFDLLKPYEPVIAYVGAERQPVLLLLKSPH